MHATPSDRICLPGAAEDLVRSSISLVWHTSSEGGPRAQANCRGVLEELELIFVIGTDDAYAIEAYWHKRFAEKRRRGEWFELTGDDLRVFQRRKFTWALKPEANSANHNAQQ